MLSIVWCSIFNVPMDQKMAYVGLGGNIGDTASLMESALQKISRIPGVKNLEISRFYKTEPIECIDSKPFLNAVCRFHTTQTPKSLLYHLQAIERSLGKEPKPKSAARKIDLDFLFLGEESYFDEELELPHPRWQERLFVLVPLMDLTSNIVYQSQEGKIISLHLPTIAKTLDQQVELVCTKCP